MYILCLELVGCLIPCQHFVCLCQCRFNIYGLQEHKFNHFKHYTRCHHHHRMPLAWISLTLSCHSSLSSIAFGRSSKLDLVSVQSSCRYVLADHPTLACPCEGVYGSTSLISSPLLLQLCPACLARLVRMVFEMGGRSPYSYCFVRCCLQDLFNTARVILVQLPSSFFVIRLVIVHMVHLCSSINTTAAWKKLRSILSDKSDLHITDRLLMAVSAFASRVLLSFSVDETLLPR